jgi:hypothetical protein
MLRKKSIIAALSRVIRRLNPKGFPTAEDLEKRLG